ncbi:MAG: cell division topological specificity factor MinE [Roseburia sp.]|uniref:cell division topological specificity factor MinE n=1 Tax=Roseburia sp. 831b TaxID=1261635 RepID=UPI0009530A93|nr:cell division topological specificity factor MinE [Roseburia sp. 831b]MCI5918657.1 cell division topological specificity factor MinE [Roseburia sp.]MDD6216580.1 cell division topological specificity factor MinE [Roseburia sp.]WVK73945.1 cell division topological specificity factor MinE [Roseburia sp. 831b]
MKTAHRYPFSNRFAKERLRLLLEQNHREIDEETVEKIQAEVGTLVTKYLDIPPENIEVKIILKDDQKRSFRGDFSEKKEA